MFSPWFIAAMGTWLTIEPLFGLKPFDFARLHVVIGALTFGLALWIWTPQRWPPRVAEAMGAWLILSAFALPLLGGGAVFLNGMVVGGLLLFAGGASTPRVEPEERGENGGQP